jgi:hypothetical protein
MSGVETMTKQSSDERDYFTDPSVLKDPYDYFQEMYSKCPVHQLSRLATL